MPRTSKTSKRRAPRQYTTAKLMLVTWRGDRKMVRCVRVKNFLHQSQNRPPDHPDLGPSGRTS